MKKIALLVCFSLYFLSTYAQDSNILIGLTSPALGINTKINFPGYTGLYGRGYWFSNEDLTNTFFGMGVYGSILNGHSDLSYAWLGKGWDQSFMSFLPNGNVGINTNNPSERLAVNGTILAKEVKVTAASSNWPDYVFAPAYKKMSLNNLERYISKNNHLPDMPSAAEAEKNGVELGEMNRKLLEKVEELTLYLIEQDKEKKRQQKMLDAQQVLIEQQAKRLEALEVIIKTLK